MKRKPDCLPSIEDYILYYTTTPDTLEKNAGDLNKLRSPGFQRRFYRPYCLSEKVYLKGFILEYDSGLVGDGSALRGEENLHFFGLGNGTPTGPILSLATVIAPEGASDIQKHHF